MRRALYDGAARVVGVEPGHESLLAARRGAPNVPLERARGRLASWLQDRTQPAWTWLTGGCHPNRDTEAAVTAAGFALDTATHRARGDMRRFEARPE